MTVALIAVRRRGSRFFLRLVAPPKGMEGPTRFLASALGMGHFTVTVKQLVRNSLVGLVRLSTSRNITSN